MRAFTFLGLLLSIAGCGRIGYDPLVSVDPVVDAAEEMPPPDGPDSLDTPRPDTQLPGDVAPEVAPETPGDVPLVDLSPDQRPIDMGPVNRPPEVAPDLQPPVDLPPDTMLPPVCNQPFSTPAVVNISGVNGDIYSPRLGPTGLILYFGEQDGLNANTVDIYFATRTVVGGAFSAQQRLVDANSNFEDNGAFETADRLELFFFSTRPGGQGGRDLWVLRRATPTAGWGGATTVTELNSNDDDYMPSLTGDGLTIFFASGRGPGSENAWFARRPSRTAPFGAPAELLEFPASGYLATAPFIQRDGLTLFFATTGQGGLDLFSATRSSTTGAFGLPASLGSMFNSSAIDDDPSLSFDGRELFFVSDRVAQTSRIYRSIRCP